MENAYIVKVPEIPDIDDHQLPDAMDIHARRQQSVMDLHALNVMRDKQGPPAMRCPSSSWKTPCLSKARVSG